MVDDDDEALQAVLLASLQAMSGDAPAAAPAAEGAGVRQQEEMLLAAVRPPLVSRPSSLSEFAKEAMLSEDVQHALSELERAPCNLKLVKVRGDGHCLFRVFAAGLVLGAAWSGHDTIDECIRHFSSDSLDPSAEHVASQIVALLTRAKASPSSAFDELVDESEGATSANSLVAALRACSVAYMRASPQRFRHCGDGDIEIERYCDDMENMDLARYGGHPELVALSESLRVRVDIHDTSALGPVAAVPTYRLGEHLLDVPIVRGLRRGLHYNCLLQASPAGDAIEGCSELS